MGREDALYTSIFRVTWTESSSRNIFSSLMLNSTRRLPISHNTRKKIEKDYTEIVRRSEDSQKYYEQMYRERSRFPLDMPMEERARILRQIRLVSDSS
jgi:hypothetical protein